MGGLDLGGVGTIYTYLAFGASFSIMHGEDFKFRSMNVLRSDGDKDSLVVNRLTEKNSSVVCVRNSERWEVAPEPNAI
jgi:hypothetical protein